MPVVEKIESLGYLVRIELDWCLIYGIIAHGLPGHYNNLQRDIDKEDNPGKLLNTYAAAVEFCKWYKQQGK